MSESPESKTFCPLPWIHLDSKASGDLRVCCPSGHGPGRGLLRDENGEVYNLAHSSIRQSRNAPLLKEIRTAMLKGEFHPECQRCSSEERAGVLSRRRIEEESWRQQFSYKDAVRITQEDGSVRGSPETDGIAPSYYDLRLGNHCNLRCRTCSPTDSNGWYDDYVDLNGFSGFRDGDRRIVLQPDPRGRQIEPSGVYLWHESDSFWEDFFTQAGSIRMIHMTGGEPFLIRRHFDFLKKCVEAGHASHITLEYNTNMTVLPRELLSLWPSFERVKIGCSIDGVGAVNDYIRHPSRFQVVEKNLAIVDTLGENVSAWIACTVSMLNICYLDDLVKWKLTKGFNKVNALDSHWPLITAHPLHRPAYLNIQVLPQKAKRFVTEKLRALPAWLESFAEERALPLPIRTNLVENGRKMAEGYSRFMMDADLSHLLPEFWEKALRLDELRGQSVKDGLPQLYELIADSRP